MAITTYFAQQIITAEERNEITFPTPNRLSAKNKSGSDCVSLSLRDLDGEGKKRRDGRRENDINEREKNEETRAGPDTRDETEMRYHHTVVQD